MDEAEEYSKGEEAVVDTIQGRMKTGNPFFRIEDKTVEHE
jgi:hypothetical protein